MREPIGTAVTPGVDPADVCTLSPSGLEQRIAWLRAEILPHTIETERLHGGLALELAHAPGLEAKLDRWAALERECCSELVFERRESRAEGRLRFEIRGLDPDAANFPSLRIARAEPSQRARLAKAAGFGLGSSLLVCCVIPIVAGMLFGAAAAPLASLDGPLPIAAGALLGGLAAWRWLPRRIDRSDEGCGC